MTQPRSRRRSAAAAVGLPTVVDGRENKRLQAFATLNRCKNVTKMQWRTGCWATRSRTAAATSEFGAGGSEGEVGASEVMLADGCDSMAIMPRPSVDAQP